MSWRAAFVVGVLAVLAVISFFLASAPPPAPDRDASALPAGYYLKNMLLQTTDAMGVVKYRLQAERADHNPLDDSIVLARLQLDYGNDENRWRFSADHGEMPNSNDSLSLSGNVTARTVTDAPLAATLFKSDTLELDIDGESATTDDPVSIQFARGTLEGVGLFADFANNRVTLRSQIRGVFSPATR